MTTQYAQHTPGPWVADGPVVEHFDAPMKPDIAFCAQGIIGNLPPNDSLEAAANARLIAAAPDLLDACKDALIALDVRRLGHMEFCGSCEREISHGHRSGGPVPTLQEAVAKAEGGDNGPDA